MMSTLLKKDFRNALLSMGPALLLGVPLLLIMQFTQSSASTEKISWNSAFWITFFFSSTALFFRSFGFENRFKNFHFYTAYKIPHLRIFLSQCAVHIISLFVMGVFYLLLSILFFSPPSADLSLLLKVLALTSLTLAPVGTFLGLILQVEREFLFSIVYLPLATPVILSAYSLSSSFEGSWLYVLLSFLVGGSFLSAFTFEFFFDELSG
jgi:ABC-type transport system involved in cytochrome c biogenesis permease component